MHGAAGDLGLSPENLEFFLFELGLNLKAPTAKKVTQKEQ
jgi:hypothetical protein